MTPLVHDVPEPNNESQPKDNTLVDLLKDANTELYLGVVALDQGGPSVGRLARSMKVEDMDSPHGDQPEALPGGRLSLSSGEEASASPLAGRR
jgi:hypothetical protein